MRRELSVLRKYRTSVGKVCIYHGISPELALEHFHNQALIMSRVFGEEAVCEVQTTHRGPWRRVVGAHNPRMPVGLCQRCGGEGTIEGGHSTCPRCVGEGVE